MISTAHLAELPDIDSLRRLMQSLAMLDAILSPEWEYRFFSFNSRWAPGKQMGSMRNGEGDHYFALFGAAGCWLKGFDHEAPMTPFADDPPRVAAGVLENVPAQFADCLTEPAFLRNEATFCIWRSYGDAAWRRGPVKLSEDSKDPDGSARLLQYLDGRPQTYHAWAQAYYDREVPLAAIRSIYAQQPLEQRVLSVLREDVSLAQLEADIVEIGYPTR